MSNHCRALCVAVCAFLIGGCSGTGEEDAQPDARAAPDAAAGTLLWVAGPAGRLRVRDVGSGGVPVLFVHSLGGARDQWAAQLAHLKGSRRSVAFDMRGHGESDPAGEYAPAAMAGDVAAVADTLGLERFVLVGHSFGGAVAGAYAGRHPDRVAGLLLVDPAGDHRGMSLDGELGSFLEALESDAYEETIEGYWRQIIGSGAAPEVRERALNALRRARPDAVRGGMRSLFESDWVEGVKRYPGPVLDVITDLNDAPYSLHKVIDVRTRRMSRVGHWLQMERPEEFNRILDRFLAGVDG